MKQGSKMNRVLCILGGAVALVCVLMAQPLIIPLGAPRPSLMSWPDGNPIRIGFGLGVTNRWLYVTNAGSGGGGGISNLTAGYIPMADSPSSLVDSSILETTPAIVIVKPVIITYTSAPSENDVFGFGTDVTVAPDTTYDFAKVFEFNLDVGGIPNPGAVTYLGNFTASTFGTNQYDEVITFNFPVVTQDSSYVSNQIVLNFPAGLSTGSSGVGSYTAIRIRRQTNAVENYGVVSDAKIIVYDDFYARTNTAPFTLITNVVAVDTLYTNRAQRATVYQAYNLTSALLTAASVDLYVDDDGDGTWDSIGLGLAAPSGVTNVLRQILSFPLQPGARYAVSNSSGAASTASAAGPSRIVYQ